MESFEVFAEKFTPMIFSIIKKLKIYKNRDEYFQIGLIALWKAYLMYNQQKGEFSNFAYTYIRGSILNELKKSRKLEDTSIYVDQTIWDNLISISHDPAIKQVELKRAIHSLSEKDQLLLKKIYILGYSLQEIASQEGVSYTAIKKRKKRALHHLKEQLSTRT